MPSATSKRTTKTTRVKHRIVRVPAGTAKNVPRSLAELRRWLKSEGAVPMTPDMKRRLIAAGEWGMPKE